MKLRPRSFIFAGLICLLVFGGQLVLDPGLDAGCGGCGGQAKADGTAPKGCACAGGDTCGAGGRGAGKGHGEGYGKGHGGGRGGQARGATMGHRANHHETIHALLGQHEAIERSVKMIDGGVETTTTSDDAEVARMIREHVEQMKQRMESGHGMRWWDPTFAELFRRHDEVRMEIEQIPGGVRVREFSDDPEVAKLIRHHATSAVSEFVADGFERAPQPTPLPEGYTAD